MKYARTLLVVALASALCREATGEEPRRPDRDQLRIAAQGICPVSGNKLGTHGTPIKVKVGNESVFLCCKGCLKGKIDSRHWQTIHSNFAKAQAKCPVMNKPLPKNPKWTIVDGQIIYICCPPCTDKISADPATYLRKVDHLYAESLPPTR